MSRQPSYSGAQTNPHFTWTPQIYEYSKSNLDDISSLNSGISSYGIPSGYLSAELSLLITTPLRLLWNCSIRPESISTLPAD